MTERRDIGSRLENWSRWALTRERRPAASQTGAICDAMRRAAEGSASSTLERRTIDEDDAWLLERAMPKLETKHRLMLWWCYIRQAPPEVVCRKTGIPQRPATEFVSAFRQAQAAVECFVANIDENECVQK
ncbi:hypothetical protein IP91_00108 [Pseudoduganella lurida]|uniref:Antitermination protein Q n=1 Tax=Pseudoduganella lurida TaxID=1036180 RepID=A0A562RJC9_9BURK|nr:hypothetical protein [Pseudoduganella lurida]TWI69043.1 hypothetical protein IP91_00108 [Pseudoduganella lurida]